jgi:hypothetical protein
MPNINEEFPSKYLKSADLKGAAVKVKIRDVQVEQIGGDRKLIMYFAGKEKGMVLNKTNARTIGDVYGEDTDAWIDQPIEVFAMKVDFQGRMVDGLRVRVLPKKAGQQRKPAEDNGWTDSESPAPKEKAYAEASGRGAPRGGSIAEELDDEIPFAPEWR